MQKPTTIDDAVLGAAPASEPDGRLSAPVVIEGRGIGKTFRIPTHKVDTLKERMTRPFTRADYRILRALDDVSFEVHKGEFFGIVGRNGSGKSTLLKILSSIYRADTGRVRVAGRVAPFIELGVGLNPELTARENIALNGVLMGLSRRDARNRLDAVLDFAELREFIDLKIKNYSSGMMVRLAFSVMIQADADVMLIDEVLAVGDAAFGQKCMDVFYERRRAGRTIVLVTHDMTTVESLCHRAMLLHDGRIQYIGDPDETALRYYRLNFAGTVDVAPGTVPADLSLELGFNTRLLSACLRDAQGDQIDNLEQGDPIRLDAEFEAAQELVNPVFDVHLQNAAGVVVSRFIRPLEATVPAGRRIRLAGEVVNQLVPDRYSMHCWVHQERDGGAFAIQPVQLVRFIVYGNTPRNGIVTLPATIEPQIEDV